MTDPVMAAALALVLDFRKAYDSVDREFLYASLLWLGFPTTYVNAMRGMHEGTRVRFLANGYRSRWVAVTCGIRQGCPLAPLLFLFVLEALYRRIDQEPKLSGIVLPSAAGSVRLKVGGYADDTASYVSTIAEVILVMSITRIFASASGLRLNEEKTLVIALNPESILKMGPLPAPLRLQAITKLSRYLGLQVGSVQDPDYTWQVARTQLVARLALATRKTLTVDQRSLIAMATVIPKLLYIGRHQWPSKGTIQAFQKMIKNYIWHGRFTECDVGGRAWLNQHVATLPRQQGGLAVPDLKMELLALAAVTVNNWAVDSDPDTQILGDVLAGCQTVGVAPQVYITPHHTPPTVHNRRVKESIWSTGLSVCNSFGGVSPAASKAAMVVALHCTLYFRGPVVATWYGRRMTLDTQPLQGPLSRQYQATEETLHGDFCSEWVPYMALEELKLFTETGVARGIKSTMRALCRNGTLVKDVLHWRWLAKGGMLVTVLVDKFTRTIRRQAERLMVLILLIFPQLLRHGEHSGRIRYETKDPAHVPVQLCIDSERRLEGLTGFGGNQGDMAIVRTHRDMIAATQRAVGVGTAVTRVHPHPRISRMVCLWAGNRRWKTSRKAYKTVLSTVRNAEGLELLRRRQHKWKSVNEFVATGLDSLVWRRIRRVVGLNPWGEQLLLRMKHHAASVYNPVSAGMGCPHEDCTRVGHVDLYHVFWTCPAAVRLRGVLIDRWRAAGLRRRSYETAIFSLEIPGVPDDIARALGQVITAYPADQAALLGDAVERLTANCWGLGAALYLHAAWRWRVAHFDPLNDTSAEYHVSGFANRLRTGHKDIVWDLQSQADPGLLARLGAKLCMVLGADWTGPHAAPPQRGCCYVIFAAGSARGRPQGGGSGTVIARVHTTSGAYTTQYIHSAVYDGGNMTAVKATQLGLLRGLRMCISQAWGPAHVVGDNPQILRQHTARLPPTVSHLKDTYWKSRRAADAAAVVSWTLQQRDQNRAASGFASLAHETEQTVEWTACKNRANGTKWTRITEHIQMDVAQWIAERSKSALYEGAEDKV